MVPVWYNLLRQPSNGNVRDTDEIGCLALSLSHSPAGRFVGKWRLRKLLWAAELRVTTRDSCHSCSRYIDHSVFWMYDRCCHSTFNLHIFLNEKEVLQRRGVWARARGFYRILKSKSLVPSEKGRNRDRISWSLERSFRGKTLRVK